MRRTLAALAACAALVPVHAAVADECDPVNDLAYDTVGYGPCDHVDRHPSVSALVIKCDHVNGVAPGTTTATWERGSAACLAVGDVSDAYVNIDAGGSDASFSYTASSPATIATSSGTFTFSSSLHHLTAYGTYTRVGAQWVFKGVQIYGSHATSRDTTGPFVATGVGAPTASGFALVIAE